MARSTDSPGIGLPQAANVTDEHFAGNNGGASQPARRRMLLYAPLYLSNHCTNHCVYCGFRSPQSIERRHLSLNEAIEQAEILQSRGFRQILLVAGEFPKPDDG